MATFRQISEIGNLVKRDGVYAVASRLNEEMKIGATDRLKPESASLRHLWEQLVGPVDSTLEYGHYQEEGFQLSEAVDSTAFNVIVGSVISAKVIAAYNARDDNTEQLVETVSSNRKTENVVGFESIEGVKQVNEGMPYQYSGFQEKYVTIDNTKYGRLIDITEELIFFDKTGQILQRAAQFGTKARIKKQRLILEGVIDLNYSAGEAGVYKPSGSYAQLYIVSGNANLNTGAGTINNTNLNTAHVALVAKTDENGDLINVTGTTPIVMHHPNVRTTVWDLANNTLISGTANNDLNPWKGMFTPVENPYIAAATTWFYGDFKSMFRWQEVWPLQVLRAAPGSPEEFNRDIKAAFKVRFFGGIGAIDYRFVQKQTT